MDSDLYDQLWRVEQEHWWFCARRHIVGSLVERYLGDAAGSRLRICDIGCGTGGNLVALAEKHDVVGVEQSPRAVEYAQRRLGDRVRQGSLPDAIELDAGAFDVVLMTDVLEHIEEDRRSAAAALRFLRPGGIVVATVPANPWLYSQFDARLHHFRRYSKRQFRAIWDWPDAEVKLLSHYNALLFAPAATVRFLGNFFRQRDATDDLDVPPRPLNTILMSIMKCESLLLGRLPIPFGLSLVAVVLRR